MTKAQLIAAMLEIAHPVIEAYHGDVRHDAKLIANAEPGSTFIWAPRSMGTFIVLLQRNGKPNEAAAQMFNAFSVTSSRDNAKLLTWQYLTIGQNGECSIAELNAEDAAIAAWEATRRAEYTGADNRVSEKHM